MKRADWKLIKNLNFNEKLKERFTVIPLVDLRNVVRDNQTGDGFTLNEVAQLARDNAHLSPKDHVNILLNRSNKKMIELILQLHVNERNITFEYITNNVKGNVSNYIFLIEKNSLEHSFHLSTMDCKGVVLATQERNFISNGDEDKEIVKMIASDLNTYIKSLMYIEQSDLYPIHQQKTSTKRGKIHQPKSWKRDDLVSIVYMNALPSGKSPSLGGHHASPRYHQRRGHERKLSHERYKDHPQYGKTIYVKPSWVGKKMDVINGVTYKVLIK